MKSLALLKTQLPSLSSCEQRVATYFLEHAGSLIATPILEVANLTHTSKSTVVRVCKRLGFQGYKDFLQCMSASLAISETGPVHGYESEVGQICLAITKQYIQAMQNTLFLLKVETVESIVQLVAGARRLDFYGMADYVVVAQDAALKFSRIGFPTRCPSSRYCKRLDASTLSKSDVAFFFFDETHETETQALIASVDHTQARSIAISSKPEGKAHYQLTVGMSGGTVHTNKLAMLGIVDLLFSSLISSHAQRYASLLQRTSTMIQQERTCI